jgi:sRNA-binding regulator protein Hfq
MQSPEAHMSDKKMTEVEFLQARITDQEPVFCFLANGVRIQGTIVANDLHALFIKPPEAEDAADVLMVMKQQISTITPISSRWYVGRNPLQNGNGVPRGKAIGRN